VNGYKRGRSNSPRRLQIKSLVEEFQKKQENSPIKLLNFTSFYHIINEERFPRFITPQNIRRTEE